MAVRVDISEIREGLYVIGTEEHNYLNITMSLRMSPNGYAERVVTSITYDFFYTNATLFTDYYKAKNVIEQIKERVEEIQFINNDPMGRILDAQNGYVLDVNKLKIFSLIPIKCREDVEP